MGCVFYALITGQQEPWFDQAERFDTDLKQAEEWNDLLYEFAARQDNTGDKILDTELSKPDREFSSLANRQIQQIEAGYPA